MQIVAIIVVNLAVYFRTIFFDIVVDDVKLRAMFAGQKKFSRKNLQNFRKKLYGAGMFASLRADHAFTLFLHTVASVLVYVTFGMNAVSFIAALLYSVHPVNNQTAVWLNGRRYLVNVIIVLVMYMFLPWGIILYPLTALFQINATPFPLLLLGTPLWWMLPIVCVIPFVNNRHLVNKFLARKEFDKELGGTEITRLTPMKVVVVVKTYGAYFFHCLVPWKVFFYPTLLQGFGVTGEGIKRGYALDKDFWVGIAAIFISIVLAVYVPMTRFPLAWFVVFILPWLNVYSVVQVFADRYASVAIIGMVLLVANVLVMYPLLAGVVLGYYVAKSLQVQKQYMTLDDFYIYQLLHNPGCVINVIHYARICMKQNMYQNAYVALRRGLFFSPDDFRLLYMYAKVLNAFNDVGLRNKVLDRCDELVEDVLFMSVDELKGGIKKLRGPDASGITASVKANRGGGGRASLREEKHSGEGKQKKQKQKKKRRGKR